MQISKVTGGLLEVNCYFLTEEKTGQTAVIDPGFVSESLEQEILKVGKENITTILLTHGHFDHITGVNHVRELTGAKVYLPQEDQAFPANPALNLCAMMTSEPTRSFPVERLLKDGDTICLGDLTIQVIHTPGHTAGSCCYLVQDALFTGDTLMAGSVGRTDFPTGSYPQILNSMKKLYQLPGDYRVFPGHGGNTTMQREREENPYLRIGNSSYGFDD